MPAADTPDRSGRKWISGNHKAKAQARRLNGGVLPYSPALETTEYPNKDVWSADNLPEILFYLIPPKSKYLSQRAAEIKTPEGITIRDYKILPTRIAVDVEGWLIEAWRRIDPRINYRDILDRMVEDATYGDVGLYKPSMNNLQNHCYRQCRDLLNNWLQYGRRDEPHKREVKTIELLTSANIDMNTVLPVCDIAKNRLVKMMFHRTNDDAAFKAVPCEVTAENLLETTLPLDFFLEDDHCLQGVQDVMKNEMMAAWELLLILQERAAVHGLPHWSKLEKQCLPITWYDRTKKKSAPRSTYDGGCQHCTWTETRDKHELSRKRLRNLLDSYSDVDNKRPVKRRPGVAARTETEASFAGFNEYELEPEISQAIKLTPIKYLESDEEDDGSWDDELGLSSEADTKELMQDNASVSQQFMDSSDDKNDPDEKSTPFQGLPAAEEIDNEWVANPGNAFLVPEVNILNSLSAGELDLVNQAEVIQAAHAFIGNRKKGPALTYCGMPVPKLMPGVFAYGTEIDGQAIHHLSSDLSTEIENRSPFSTPRTPQRPVPLEGGENPFCDNRVFHGFTLDSPGDYYTFSGPQYQTQLLQGALALGQDEFDLDGRKYLDPTLLTMDVAGLSPNKQRQLDIHRAFGHIFDDDLETRDPEFDVATFLNDDTFVLPEYPHLIGNAQADSTNDKIVDQSFTMLISSDIVEETYPDGQNEQTSTEAEFHDDFYTFSGVNYDLQNLATDTNKAGDAVALEAL